jgi:hypothetical protein
MRQSQALRRFDMPIGGKVEQKSVFQAMPPVLLGYRENRQWN